MVLQGSPAQLSQQLDGGGEMHSTASTIDYSPATDTAILIGDARVDQPGRGSYSGARLVYNTSTGAMQGEGGSGGQVHLIFQPHDKIATPKPAKAAKPTTLAPPTAQPAHASSGGQP
ncbi:OstA-like protein [mine drainage metagenome]|uniref:OstA-like protein n=1 Tax=mine drainage metagenome TaxID=410659 RepID=T0ZEL6_9ZZZZ